MSRFISLLSIIRIAADAARRGDFETVKRLAAAA